MKRLTAILIFWIWSNWGGSQAAAQSVKHVVLFKLKPGISKTDPRVATGMEKMRTMQKTIPLIAALECGINFSERPVAQDIGLYTTFKNRADLQEYLRHPAHVELVQYWKELADWTIADFE